MSFAHPFLLAAGLAALAFPVWIHLRRGRVKKRAVVSSLRLMRAAPETSRRPRRIIDLPLLLLRALLFLLLAFAFGRMLIPGLPAAAARKYEVFIIDVSGSMQAKDGEQGSSWSVAHDRLQQSLAKLNASSQVALVLSPSGDRPADWVSRSTALEQAKNLTPGYGANRLAQSLREAKRLLSAMPDDHPKAIHLISDCQQSAFSGIDDVTLPAGVELEVVKVGGIHSDNRGIAVATAHAGLSTQSVYSFNDGSAGRIELAADGQTIELPVTPGEGAARLNHSGGSDQWLTRTLSAAADDAITADNTSYDAYRGQNPIPVWLWEPGTVAPPVAPSKKSGSNGRMPGSRAPVQAAPATAALHVYEQPSYYIRRALQPSDKPEDGSFSRFQPEMLAPAGLADALQSSIRPHLLIIPVSAEVPQNLASLARKVTDDGGAVIFFGGPSLNPESFEKNFGALSGVSMGEREECPSPALTGNAGAGLSNASDSAPPLSLAGASLKFRHELHLTPDASALVSFSDGAPFITERHEGRGRVYFVNASPDRAWGDWPASAPQFIPAMHVLAARALDDGALGFDHDPVLAGEKVALRLGASHAGRSLKLHDELLPVNRDGEITGVSFPEPGIQDLQLDDGTSIGKVAVNFPPSESALDCFSEPVARQRLESLRQLSGEPVVRWDREEQGGAAWRLCLLAAAFLLVIEPVIAANRAQS